MDASPDRTDQSQTPGGFVFLSYARPDRATATAVIDILQAAGYSVWWDDMIGGGERFAARIGEVLDAARAVIVLWSKASVASHWVQDEATRGIERQCLVPLSIDGSDPPLGFRQFHCIDMSGRAIERGGPAVQALLRTVEALCDRAPIPATPVPQRPARPGRRTVLLGGAGLVAAGAGVGYWRFVAGRGAAQPNSLVVLPFENLSGDPRQQYFSDGLAAEVRTQLSRNPLLHIVGQASSNSFRDHKEDAEAIARKLGVGYLLDGNVRVSGGTVRVAIELIEGRSGFSKWSNSFDRPMTNIFQVQQEIAEAVDATLAATFTEATTDKQQRGGGTGNVAAFDAYLRGKDLFDSQRDESSDRGALARFDDAIRLDPGYAAARAARSRALAVIANQYAQGRERRSLYDEAVVEAKRAVDRAPAFADAYAALGYALFYGKIDVVAAEQPYQQASRFGQGNPDVLSRYALYRARRGQLPAAYAAIARAVSLDPLNPGIFKTEGLIRFSGGDYDGAIASARRALEINPARATLHGDIGNALLMMDKTDTAAAEFAQESVGLLALPGQAFVARRRGDEAGVRKAYDELVRQFGDNCLYQQAQILSQWGKAGEALDVLDAARAAGDAGLVILYIDPFLKPLRGEPRFAALLKALRFT